MKTQLQLSTAAVRAYCIRPSQGQGKLLLRVIPFIIFLQFCIFAFLPISAQTFAPDFTDLRDGETYKTVIMPDGKRWMAENLRYRTGLNNPIFSNNTTANTFAASKNTYYCPGPGPLNASVNQADPLACEYWGALYPWWVAYANAANTAVHTTLGEQGVCPAGWHLPTDNEWNLLFTKIGGATDAGKLLKDTARGAFVNNQAWKRYWTNAALQNTNSYGFSALAAGLRTTAGAYSGNGTRAFFWTSTPNTNGTQASSKIFNYNSNLGTGTSIQNRSDALSVRCVEGSCDEEFSVELARKSCGLKTTISINEEFTSTIKSIAYELSVPNTTGTWTYSFTVKDNTLSSLPNFTVSNNNTANAFITLTYSNLLPVDADKKIILSVSASNALYCAIEQDFVFTMKDISNQNASTTITGGEAINTIRQMTDPRDGKNYQIIKMADGKWWMRENLNYQTGLTFRSTSNQPSTVAGGGAYGIGSFWCPGTNGATTSLLTDCNTWGALYTWECAVSLDGTGVWEEPASSQIYTNIVSGNPTSTCSRGICPQGWHLPSDREWGDMLNAVETSTKNHNTSTGWLGANAGTILKSSTFASGVKQSTGFSVIAAGMRSDNGSNFGNRGGHAPSWTSTAYSSTNAWYRHFDSGYATAFRTSINRSRGYTVRCLMD